MTAIADSVAFTMLHSETVDYLSGGCNIRPHCIAWRRWPAPARTALPLSALHMKAVQDAVRDGGEDDASDEYDRQPAVERIEAGEQFAAFGDRSVDRAHAAQQHGGIEEGINPGEAFQPAVAGHADQQRDDDQRERNGAAVGQPDHEPLCRNHRLGVMLEFRQQLFHGAWPVVE